MLLCMCESPNVPGRSSQRCHALWTLTREGTDAARCVCVCVCVCGQQDHVWSNMSCAGRKEGSCFSPVARSALWPHTPSQGWALDFSGPQSTAIPCPLGLSWTAPESCSTRSRKYVCSLLETAPAVMEQSQSEISSPAREPSDVPVLFWVIRWGTLEARFQFALGDLMFTPVFSLWLY